MFLWVFVLLWVVVMCSFVNISPVIDREGWVFCTSQAIGCEDHHRYFVEVDAKPYC